MRSFRVSRSTLRTESHLAPKIAQNAGVPADAVIVGGGIVGAACALEFARAGMKVTLLERSELAAGASGRNHGLLFRPTDADLVSLYVSGLEIYRRLHTPFSFLYDDEPRGILVVYDSTESRAGAEEEARFARGVGVPVDELDGDGVRAIEPNLAHHVGGGFLLHDGMRVDPSLLTLAMAIEARRLGAAVRTNTAVKGVVLAGDRVRGIACDDGLIEAEVVVLAAGPWTPKLALTAGVAVPVHSARGWIAHVGPAPGLVRHIVEYGGWHLPPGVIRPPVQTVADLSSGVVSGDANVIFHPGNGDTYLLGGSRLASVRDEPESPEIVNELARKAIRLVPALQGVPVLRAWSGVRPMSPDGRPIIGRLPPEGLWVATGHGSQGVILAGGTARVLAQLVTGDLQSGTLLSPARFET